MPQEDQHNKHCTGRTMRISTAISFMFIHLLIFSFLTVSVASCEESDRFFQNIWKEFSEVCNDATEYMTNEARSSRTALEVLTFREPKYTRILNEAQDILGQSQVTRQFEDIEKLRFKNRDMAVEMDELKRKRISAPESSYNPLADTKKRIDRKLASLPRKIAENEAAIEALKHEILEELNKHGINLASEELNYFLVSAEGDDLLRLMTIAENMKKIQAVIEQQLKDEPNNVNLARVYTGMYLVSLDAYANAHDAAIKNISGYRDRLKNIHDEAKQNYSEASKLRKSALASEVQNIDSNLHINERTMEIADMYDSLLKRRNANLEQSKSNVLHRVDIARNTYKTLKNGSNLIALVNTGSNDYLLLINFEMPELKSIYDAGMLNAFADISEKIRTEN